MGGYCVQDRFYSEKEEAECTVCAGGGMLNA
jgi:hypothetical protein